jgi:hypothetical protein
VLVLTPKLNAIAGAAEADAGGVVTLLDTAVALAEVGLTSCVAALADSPKPLAGLAEALTETPVNDRFSDVLGAVALAAVLPLFAPVAASTLFTVPEAELSPAWPVAVAEPPVLATEPLFVTELVFVPPLLLMLVLAVPMPLPEAGPPVAVAPSMFESDTDWSLSATGLPVVDTATA